MQQNIVRPNIRKPAYMLTTQIPAGYPDTQVVRLKYMDIQGKDCNLNEHGIFIYPLPEEK